MRKASEPRRLRADSNPRLTWDGSANDRIAGNLTDDEEAAGGLGISKEDEVFFTQVGVQVGAYPLQVAARAARDEPFCQGFLRALNGRNSGEV